jgi:hypothetical protein
MRPFGIDDDQRLLFARERARDLKADWRRANGTRSDRFGDDSFRLGLIARIRLATGLRIAGDRLRVAARQSEPCS